MKKEQKWNIFLVKIEDKDDEWSTQHVIAGPRLGPIDKGDKEGWHKKTVLRPICDKWWNSVNCACVKILCHFYNALTSLST